MALQSPENFPENGARPVQIPGSLLPIDRLGALVFRPNDGCGNTIVGGRPVGRLTRIAGCDVSGADGHTVGKTFCRKELLGFNRTHQVAQLRILNRMENRADRRIDSGRPRMLNRTTHAERNGGRQASAICRPVSLVPLIQGVWSRNSSPVRTKNHRTQQSS